MPSVDDSIQFVKGIGPKKAKLLEKLHIRTLREALETYPRDYEDRTHITPIAEIGMEDKYAVRAVVGTEPKVNRIRKGLTLVKCTIYDETGTLIWEAPCVSGTPNGAHNTPTGVFWLNQKASPSVLKGTNLDGSKYESAVRYWMPFVGNVIGLHDADWQAAFGGTLYQQGRGSHGCVNLPVGSAADLFGIIQSGDVVVCHW